MKKPALFLIQIYKRLISPILQSFFGRGCRFTPTCSEYSSEAIRRFGLVKGGRMSLIRFFKCHPFSGQPPYDPVPEVVN